MEMESYDNDAIRSSETVAGISKQSSKTYGPIYISGDARVQLGDNYALNRDIFETGTPEQKRTGRCCRSPAIMVICTQLTA